MTMQAVYTPTYSDTPTATLPMNDKRPKPEPFPRAQILRNLYNQIDAIIFLPHAPAPAPAPAPVVTPAPAAAAGEPAPAAASAPVPFATPVTTPATFVPSRSFSFSLRRPYYR